MRQEGVRHSILALVFGFSLLTPLPAAASSTPAPGRELTHDDRMALTVQRAGSVVIGRMVSDHDTTEESSDTFQKARFATDRRLKGPRVARSLSFCWLPRGMQARLPGTKPGRSLERPWPDDRFVLFLQKPDFKGASANTYGGALQRTCAWYAIQSPGLHGYYLDDRLPWSAALEKQVRAAIARQEIDALIRRADRVVLGRILPASEKRAASGSTYNGAPRTVAVARTLKGARRARLDLQPVVPFWNQPEGWSTEGKREFLWLLRRTRGGALEPVELLAGIVEVRGGRVPAWDMSLDAAIDRIRSVRPR